MNRRLVPLTIAALLALPATAAAETLTVAPGQGGCDRGSDNTCPTIGAAVAEAQAADTISILAGTYSESVSVPDTKDDLTIKGASATTVKIAGTLAIAADGVGVSDLAIEAAGGAVTVSGSALIARAFIVQGGGDPGTPAVDATGANGTTLVGALVANTVGPAARFSASENNRLVRTTLVASDATQDAVQVISAGDSPNPKKLVLDSSVLLGGAEAAGLLAKSEGAPPLGSEAGDITVDARRITVRGSAKGVVLDASEAAGPLLPVPGAAGNITGVVTSSIVHGDSSATPNESVATGNEATLTFNRSDAPPNAEGEENVTMNETSFTPDEQLFAGNSPRLRADAPVIDKGTAPAGDDATQDFEGDPRVVGAASDIGADEFLNKKPDARFGITDANPRQNQPVGFISGSGDPEQGAGGGIVEYRWDFGDGTKQTTTAGAVAHSYANVGAYKATLTVVDKQGAVSDPAPLQTVTVKDGIAPAVSITAPRNGQRLTLNPKPRKGRKRAPRRLTVRGSVSDAAGVKSVEVALTQTHRGKRRLSPCRHYSGRVLARKACDAPIWVKATLNGTSWRLVTKKRLRLVAGRYELRVRATDVGGNRSAAPSTNDRTLVRIRVR